MKRSPAEHQTTFWRIQRKQQLHELNKVCNLINSDWDKHFLTSWHHVQEKNNYICNCKSNSETRNK